MRKSNKCLIFAFVLLIPFHNGIARAESKQQKSTIVVTTSMLACAAQVLLQENQAIEVVRLTPPGSCPGHFDLSPGMLYLCCNQRCWKNKPVAVVAGE